MTPQQQGRQAQANGRILEKSILPVLIARGFHVLSHTDWANKPDTRPPDVVLTNAPYTNIYGRRAKSEFLILSQRLGLEVRVECKWQQASGSVDEKFPYYYLNAVFSYGEKAAFIVADGDGFRQGAIDWLKDAVAKKLYQPQGFTRDIRVFNLAQFIAWVNTTV